MTFCLVYLDDILVFSATFEEDCEHLVTIFNKLEQHTLKLKASNVTCSSKRSRFWAMS